MVVVHLTSSRFFGGPERQMLGLAENLACRSAFLSFSEGGRCEAFLTHARRAGFSAQALENDTPYLRAAVNELAGHLQDLGAGVLCCNGYKANLAGRLAARRMRVPAIAVSRGWTGETWKVRVYEALDRLHLRLMSHVVCVSEAQAVKVRRAGVPHHRVSVIRNAVQTDRFENPDPDGREQLLSYFDRKPQRIIGAVGRLSPEKGFAVLIEAARQVASSDAQAGFLIFGDGGLRANLERRIATAGLGGGFVLAGFRTDLDRLLPSLDALVLPSYSEGLPNVVLEAFAAGVPVVATAVGGIPEIVADGENGYLVPPGDATALAARMRDLLGSRSRRREMGQRGKERVQEEYTFETQARAYARLFAVLTDERYGRTQAATQPSPVTTSA
jgi:glycosyltransferase involved in cell wall biosynthesis